MTGGKWLRWYQYFAGHPSNCEPSTLHPPDLYSLQCLRTSILNVRLRWTWHQPLWLLVLKGEYYEWHSNTRICQSQGHGESKEGFGIWSTFGELWIGWTHPAPCCCSPPEDRGGNLWCIGYPFLTLFLRCCHFCSWIVVFKSKIYHQQLHGVNLAFVNKSKTETGHNQM